MSTSLPKILCVDDDESTLDALSRLLRKDFEVLRAEEGAKALHLLKQNPDVAIILSDYRMPRMTGVQFLNQAKEIAPQSTRAILSGQIDLQDLMSAVNSQAIHRLILKPWDNEYLMVQMREALQIHLLIKQKDELEKLSITDPVTGLPNHRYFQESLRREIERAQRHSRSLSLLMVDVDRFKEYNDRYGHPKGDVLLKEVGEQIASEVRTLDLVARYGGEEFSVIMPDTKPDEAYKVAERIRQSFVQKPVGHVTISIGLAGLTTERNSASVLIEAADQALYQAKGRGRNQTVIAP
jgi:diguanylate cyclase (GGDEF)-like protein